MLTKSLEWASQIPWQGSRKTAIQLSATFENAILSSNPEGRGVFGPERDLASIYAVSPKAVRQALRILESRFLGTVRRGAPGGLSLRVPSVQETAELMAIYLSAIGSGYADVVAAQEILLPEMKSRPAPARDFVTAILSALKLCFERNAAQPAEGSQTRALTIARRIVLDLQRHAGDKRRLGTLVELEERHASGRPIILQAIRILEELEMVEMVLGRGGGIAWRKPSPGAVVRAIYPHFSLQHLKLDTSRDIIWSINLVTAVHSASRKSAEQIVMLDGLLQRLRSRNFDTQDYSGQVVIWRILGDLAGNEVLHMLARCIFYFQLQSDKTSLERILESLPDAVLKQTCRLASAVIDGDIARARQAVMASENIARQQSE